MALFGTLVNVLLIVIGSVIGRFLGRIPERIRETVTYAIGLAVLVIGIQMSFATSQIIIVIISIVVGAAIGEWLDLDGQLNRLGRWMDSKAGKTTGESGQGGIAQGFVTATLIFVIGSMAVIGAIDSGLRNDHDVLIAKGIIDGFTALILSSTLGIGVILSAVPVFIYQGAITMFASVISRFIPDDMMRFFIEEMTATGGLMILAIGLNLIGLTKIRVANLIPGILVVALVTGLLYGFGFMPATGE
ncbi:DUF554 domain-containing protein [Bhargavaea beijingensis]|uniref:DUF554 domain-containing protein n=1 Tax=Bhargavaea beijingensis TaxID=426756 RepID=A0A1G7EUC1_9BACL|nr:DUF554 domain-containing protein [Bhargavaea beijingensis]MCW1929055.1 DUF554 domain-containing protein [Bhargavaea beijingensis]RSK34436.1 DUF554 domain-containing protein [Bhargavaea beijingensis]SDE67015.1 hypothetical protein SAMN04488126_11517 [Bhargavaea beijingensis]